jgi:hypothetical protein
MFVLPFVPGVGLRPVQTFELDDAFFKVFRK